MKLKVLGNVFIILSFCHFTVYFRMNLYNLYQKQQNNRLIYKYTIKF